MSTEDFVTDRAVHGFAEMGNVPEDERKGGHHRFRDDVVEVGGVDAQDVDGTDPRLFDSALFRAKGAVAVHPDVVFAIGLFADDFTDPLDHVLG